MAQLIGFESDADGCSIARLHPAAVDRRKFGRMVCYRLVDDHLRDLVLGAATHVAEHA